jgi:hypothetical protein
VHEKTSGLNERMRQRGGSKYTPLRLLQLVIALVVLVSASIFLIRGALYGMQSGWVIGFILTIIGCILPFIEVPE